MMQIKPYIRKPFYYETDQMQVVHHSNYIRWFEE
ncbi:MAG TPA: acyl-CoA thioesterase, partial [Acholeplasmataceae bacterium]|nr:acyl-CoA thioesterase [Acholeplasmataceae bacterium]